MGYLSLFACLGDLGAQPSAVVVIVSTYDTETSREVEPPSRKRLVRLKYTPATIHRCDQPCSLNPRAPGNSFNDHIIHDGPGGNNAPTFVIRYERLRKFQGISGPP